MRHEVAHAGIWNQCRVNATRLQLVRNSNATMKRSTKKIPVTLESTCRNEDSETLSVFARNDNVTNDSRNAVRQNRLGMSQKQDHVPFHLE